MSRKPIIAIDVDCTLVDVVQPWMDFFGITHHHGAEVINGTMNEFVEKNRTKNLNVSVSSFWDKDDLYDDLKPMKRAQACVAFLAERANIVIVSICTPGHKKSKEEFIKKYFGDYPFIDTKEKHLVRFDAIIEDNVTFLNTFKQKQIDLGIVPKTGIWCAQLIGKYHHAVMPDALEIYWNIQSMEAILADIEFADSPMDNMSRKGLVQSMLDTGVELGKQPIKGQYDNCNA